MFIKVQDKNKKVISYLHHGNMDCNCFVYIKENEPEFS